jgi:hypothetical protein
MAPPIEFEWGPWEEGLPLDKRTALHFRARRFALDHLEYEARVVQDVSGKAGLGVVVVAFFDGMELGQSEAFGLDLSGFPINRNSRVLVNSVATDLVQWATHQAHIAVRSRIESVEAQLKRLLIMRQAMGRIELVSGEASFHLTLDRAHAVISRQRGVKMPFPFRLALVDDDTAAVYDKVSNLLGHIRFEPDNAEARAGLVYLGLPDINEQEKLP